MAMVSTKEINKKLNCALRCFRDAIKLARENLVVGEVTFADTKVAKVKKPRVKKMVTPVMDGTSEKE